MTFKTKYAKQNNKVPLAAKHFCIYLDDCKENWDKLNDQEKYDLACSREHLAIQRGMKYGYLLFAPVGLFISLFIVNIIMLLFKVHGSLFHNIFFLKLTAVIYFLLGFLYFHF